MDVELALGRAGVRSAAKVVAVVLGGVSLEDVKVDTLGLLVPCCVVGVTGGSCVRSVLTLVRGGCSVSDPEFISGTRCGRGLVGGHMFRCKLGSDVTAIDIDCCQVCTNHWENCPGEVDL